jgi:hypothetical protein
VDLGGFSMKTTLEPGKEEAVGTGQVNVNNEEHHIRHIAPGLINELGYDLRYMQYMTEVRNVFPIYNFGQNMEERDHMGDLDVDEGLTLK